MLSYQHGYHAGNPADLHKHLVLAELIAKLTEKERPITYAESHAGRGLYDLTAPEALKTGEAAEGINLITPDGATPFGRAVHAIRTRHGQDYYPGSPMVAAALLRDTDRLVLMERHPQEVIALRKSMRGTKSEIHHRDGIEGLLALAPMVPRKGLILIDPSYEVKSDYEVMVTFITGLVKKWPEATILLWYPVLATPRHLEMVKALAPLGLHHEVQFALKGGVGMTGSGLVLINPIYGTENIFTNAVTQAAGVLRES